MNDSHRTRLGPYDIVVALLGGASLGWFSWWFFDGYGGGSRLPLVLHQALWIGGAVALVVWGRTRAPSHRRWWMHLLWVPVVLFALVMFAVIMALRNFQ